VSLTHARAHALWCAVKRDSLTLHNNVILLLSSWWIEILCHDLNLWSHDLHVCSATTYINENFAGVCYAMSEVDWTRLSVAYLLLVLFVQSVFDPCLDNISYLLSTDVTATSRLKILQQGVLQCARLNIEHVIRVCLARIPPRLDKLCSAKQAQPSHWTEHYIMNIKLVNIFGDCLIFETEVLSVGLCAITFRCCARNLAFSRIQVVWVRNLNKTCSGPTRSTKGWSQCALGRVVRHTSLAFLWGPQRDKGWKLLT